MKMRLALIQMAARQRKEESLETAEHFIQKAAAEGADIAVLPEMFNCPYANESFPLYAEPEGGESFLRMSEAASGNRIILVSGTMPERDAAARIYNTCYVFGRDGDLLAKHRKMHLFDIDIKGGQHFMESETLSAGNEVTVFDTEFCRCGIEICYDIRFPELARLTADAGAKLIVIPAAFNMTTGPAHWELSFRARALDNQVFMAGCSQARQEAGYISYGNSLVTSPWGDVIARMDEKEGMMITDIDLTRVDQVRDQLPLLKQRRKDIYRVERI